MPKKDDNPSFSWKARNILTAIEDTKGRYGISPEETRDILKYLLKTVYKEEA
jgi:hypothetical protein